MQTTLQQRLDDPDITPEQKLLYEFVDRYTRYFIDLLLKEESKGYDVEFLGHMDSKKSVKTTVMIYCKEDERRKLCGMIRTEITFDRRLLLDGFIRNCGSNRLDDYRKFMEIYADRRFSTIEMKA